MKTKVIIISILMGLLTLTACKSREENVIDQLSSLSERIEKHGNEFDADDWEEALEDLSKIHEEMQDCKFTKDQLKQLGAVEGSLSAIIVNKGAKALNNGLSDAMDNLGTFFSGFRQGLEDNIDKEEIENANAEISDILNNLSEELQE